MDSRSAISIRNLSKSYTIAHDVVRHVTLAETLLARLRQPFKRSTTETFWALQDVSVEIAQGDVVGIIGRNGAGKSTLLKILGRITEPTQGEIEVYGRIGSLLEVGTGFHPELTGRENVYLNGAILGMRRKEIERQFDAIVDFAGIERFLDTPVKRYSSGMYVRLAFAVAAHLQSEILVVDEVLAVGDIDFQRKCLGKMKDVASSGRTVLFVSHHMQSISALCTKAMYLASGKLTYMGDVRQAIDLYMNQRPTETLDESARRRPGTGELRITDLHTDKAVYQSTDDLSVSMNVEVLRPGQPRYFISMEIVNAYGVPVLHLDSRLLNLEFPAETGRSIRYTISEPRLAQGDYRINLYLCSSGGMIDRYEQGAQFTISPLLPYPAMRADCVGHAMVYPEFNIDHEEVVKDRDSGERLLSVGSEQQQQS